LPEKEKEGCKHPSSLTDRALYVNRSERFACVPIRAGQAHLPRVSQVSNGKLQSGTERKSKGFLRSPTSFKQRAPKGARQSS